MTVQPLDPALRDFVAVEHGPPLSVVVKNISGQPLRGLTVRFAIKGSDGKWLNFESTSVNLDPRTRPTMLPDESRIVFPAGISSVGLMGADMEVQASVEVVVDSAGGFHGPDTLDVFAVVSAKQRAREWLKDRLKGMTRAEQQIELETLSAQHVRRSGLFDRSNCFDFSVQQTAALLLRLSGSEEFDVSKFFGLKARQLVVTRVR
jgi:hypothetical protein